VLCSAKGRGGGPSERAAIDLLARALCCRRTILQRLSQLKAAPSVAFHERAPDGMDIDDDIKVRGGASEAGWEAARQHAGKQQDSTLGPSAQLKLAPALPCLALPCPALPYPTASCPALSCPCPALPAHFFPAGREHTGPGALPAAHVGRRAGP